MQDTPFLLSPGHLSEQQVDRIILQLNRYCPQILSNKDAEKVRGGPGRGGEESSKVKTRLFGVTLDTGLEVSRETCDNTPQRDIPGSGERGCWLGPTLASQGSSERS